MIGWFFILGPHPIVHFVLCIVHCALCSSVLCALPCAIAWCHVHCALCPALYIVYCASSWETQNFSSCTEMLTACCSAPAPLQSLFQIFSVVFCACHLLSSITCTMCNLFLVQPCIFSRLSVFLCASYSAQRLSHCWWCTERSCSSLPHRYPLQPVKTFEMPFKVRWCAKEDHFIQLAGQGAPADSLCWSHLAGKIRLQ